MADWKLKQTSQCKTCPWIKGNDPFDIPNGYSVEKHCNLDKTIAKDTTFDLSKFIQVMACHYSDDSHCIGWLNNQLNEGNNIAMRIGMMSCVNANKVKLRGEQHERFEDTLPKI